MEGIDAGSYRVDVELRGVPDSPEQKLNLAAGEVRRVDLPLPAGRISGQVKDKDTDEPVAGVQVLLERYVEEDAPEDQTESRVMAVSISAVTSGDGGGDSIRAISIGGGAAEPIVTDAEGRYEIPHVKEGKYILVATGGGYARKERGPVEVDEGETTKNQDIDVERGYRVSGVLKNASTGKPVSFMPVFLEKRDEKTKEWIPTESMGFAQEDGSFEFKDLKSGDYKLKVQSPEFRGEMEIFLTRKDLDKLELLLSAP
jgi:5-hydroxyisourate hydrolase-like protein (transthyretin family)